MHLLNKGNTPKRFINPDCYDKVVKMTEQRSIKTKAFNAIYGAVAAAFLTANILARLPNATSEAYSNLLTNGEPAPTKELFDYRDMKQRMCLINQCLLQEDRNHDGILDYSELQSTFKSFDRCESLSFSKLESTARGDAQ